MKRLLLFLAGLSPSVGFYLWWSYERFGSWRDQALWLWYNSESMGYARTHIASPFSLHYLPMNLYTALFLSPVFDAKWPYIHPSPVGQAIIFTSPAFIVALRASWKQWQTWFLWGAVALSMSGALLVWSNGVEQFGAKTWEEGELAIAAELHCYFF